MRADAEMLGRMALESARPAPLIAHVIHSLRIGGLENGLVNLINRIPDQRFRHAVICLTDYSDFSKRIRRADVPVIALHKPPGKSLAIHGRLWRLFRELRPDIVHTRNLSALEAQLPAALAGVRTRIHSEHGRDADDLDGLKPRNLMIRRALRPLVGQFIALSRDLEGYLRTHVRVAPRRLTQIYNGVDAELFHPASPQREPLPLPGFAGPDSFVIGTVGRMQQVKDPLNLARAFVHLLRSRPELAQRCRLVMIGDGPLREQVAEELRRGGCAAQAWLAGERSDVPGLMRGLDLFVLPSMNEGISNTILEAMAAGLPVLATAVGGNPELVEADVTGTLVPPSSPQRIAEAMLRYAQSAELCRAQGAAARRSVEQRFSMQAMVDAYLRVYDAALAAGRGGAGGPGA